MNPDAPGELPCSLAGLPEEAQHRLEQAGHAYSNDELAEEHLAAAMCIAPDHLAVHVACYRYLFYKGRLNDALKQLGVCMTHAARQSGLPEDWRDLNPYHADFGSYDAVWPRFFLFALKAYGYICIRLNDIEGGCEAVIKAIELDPSDKVGAKLLLDVVARQGQDDYE